VRIQFPWGTLLRGLVTGDPEALSRLIRVCAPDANLKMIISLDPSRDQSEMARWNLPPIDVEYVRATLFPRYEKTGFQMMEARVLSASEIFTLNSSWAKRLYSSNRLSILMTGMARRPSGPQNSAFFHVNVYIKT
jgi:16S rRNA (adenine(1408)-N(1))-methyltransferase